MTYMEYIRRVSLKFPKGANAPPPPERNPAMYSISLAWPDPCLCRGIITCNISAP